MQEAQWTRRELEGQVNRFAVLLLLMWMVTPVAWVMAQTEEIQFDGLGGNKSIVETLKALNPDIDSEVVQSRFVPLAGRVELIGYLGLGLGGDTYVRNNQFGATSIYHFTERWAVGLGGSYFWNSFTPEGEAAYRRAAEIFSQNPEDPNGQMPEINYLRSSLQAFIQYSPVYGKVSWFGSRVTHFDWFFQGGAAQLNLLNGSPTATMFGTGLSFWLSPKWSMRVDGFWLGYQAEYLDGMRSINLTQLQAGVGILF